LATIVGANTGDVCRVPSALREHYVCQSVALVRPIVSALSELLMLYLNSEQDGRRHWNRYIYGQGRPHLSFDQIRTTAVPVPPLAEAAEIVAHIHEQLSLTSRIAELATPAHDRIDTLDQAILAKAFRGELVPQNQNDEPASALLERIRLERARAEPPKSRGRKQKTPAAPKARAKPKKAKRSGSNGTNGLGLGAVLGALKRDALHRIADAEQIELAERRSLEGARQGIAQADLSLKAALGHLKRDELKAVCRALDLDDRGRLKAELVGRILSTR